MSVYSGFSTRSQEAQYYRLVENLIGLLQAKALYCLKHYPRAEDSAWAQRFNSVYNSMKTLELHKYLEPKLSESCTEVANFFSFDVGLDPVFSELNYSEFVPAKTSENKALATPRKKKEVVRTRRSGEREKKSTGKLGMSKYYGQIMDNFLAKPKSNPPKKKTKGTISMDSQDFWLLDDRIKVIENDIEL
jgi:hypothetical protein